MKAPRLLTLLVTAVLVAVLAGGPAAARSPKNVVVVPRHAQATDVLRAYNELHALGLRVEITEPIAISALRVPDAVRVLPRPGTRVPRGSVVRIIPGPGLIGSAAVLKAHPRYRVPSFRGQTAQSAVGWAEEHAMFWAIPHLPALPPASASRLLDAYRVTAQRPRAGGTIVQGVMVGRGFRPTPLTLTLVLG